MKTKQLEEFEYLMEKFPFPHVNPTFKKAQTPFHQDVLAPKRERSPSQDSGRPHSPLTVTAPVTCSSVLSQLLKEEDLNYLRRRGVWIRSFTWGRKRRKKVTHESEASQEATGNPGMSRISCTIFTVGARRRQNPLTVMVRENIRRSPIKYYLCIFCFLDVAT